MRWNSSTYALRQSKTSTLLPFLYQTRTLKSAPLVTRKSCRNPIQPGVNVQGVVLLHSKRHYAARSLVYDEHDKSSFVNSIPAEYPKTSSRKPKPASRHSNASIPFEHSNPPFLKDEFQDSSDPRGNAGPRSVSLTEKEKRIFEKLFKKVEREEKGKDNDKVNANTSERAQTGDPLTSAPLSAHFNHLIATHEKDPLADLDHRSKSPRSSEEGSDNSVSSPSPEETSTTARSFLSSYLSAVATAPTDAAIWSLLQSDIFPLIKAILPPTPEPTPAPQPTSNEKSSSARSRRIDRRKAAKGSSSAKNQTDPIPSDPPSSTEESIQPPPSPPLTDYKSNDLPPIPPSLSPSLPSLLPPLFTLTLRHLRLHFHLSPYPFLLLPHLHTHISPLASHLITSNPFYNELLYLTFSHQPLPLHGMISLLDEMRNNGIEGDEVTLGILNVLKRKRDRAFKAGGRVEDGGVWADERDLLGRKGGSRIRR